MWRKSSCQNSADHVVEVLVEGDAVNDTLCDLDLLFARSGDPKLENAVIDHVKKSNIIAANAQGGDINIRFESVNLVVLDDCGHRTRTSKIEEFPCFCISSVQIFVQKTRVCFAIP